MYFITIFHIYGSWVEKYDLMKKKSMSVIINFDSRIRFPKFIKEMGYLFLGTWILSYERNGMRFSVLQTMEKELVVPILIPMLIFC